MDLEQEVRKINDRNGRVEADKAWETSLVRRGLIAILTYIVVAVFFVFANFPHPYLSALVPALGFILSTLTISLAKSVWVRRWEDKRETI